VLGAEFKWRDFSGSAVGWGGEPYSRTRFRFARPKLVDFNVDYRNILYFNSLPSFANPLGTFSQRQYDVRKRGLDANIDFNPGGRIVPFFNYVRDWDEGHGVENFVADLNEYPVRTLLSNSTHRFRGGARFEFNKFHLTLEQGGSKYADDQNLLNSVRNAGNRQTPFLGETLFLTSLTEIYQIRGNSVFSAARASWTPLHWVDFSGQFLYSRPKSDVVYNAQALGNFVNLDTLTFSNTLRESFSIQASLPHTSGSFAVEVRPMRKIRVLESWMTDRFETAINFNYSRQQIEALFEVMPKLTLRGGHRYVFGDATLRAPGFALEPVETGKLRQNVGLAGATWLPLQKVSVTLDFEGASADQVYFRTSLRSYRKGTARVQYQALASLNISVSSSTLDNNQPDLRYTQSSLSAFWNPTGGKRFSILADYSFSSLRSDLSFVVPQDRSPDLSRYRENAHTGTAVFELALPRSAQLSLGGSVFANSGSRPTRYYQPLSRFSVKIRERVSLYAEWRWYSLFENLYAFEAFRTHIVTGGIRIRR
jgi:hypothetical protein